MPVSGRHVSWTRRSKTFFCRFQSHFTVRKVYKTSWRFIYFQDYLFYVFIWQFFSYNAQVVLCLVKCDNIYDSIMCKRRSGGSENILHYSSDSDNMLHNMADVGNLLHIFPESDNMLYNVDLCPCTIQQLFLLFPLLHNF